MASTTSDPTRWLTDLLTADHPLSPIGTLAQAPDAVTAAVTPWLTAAAELTAWQLKAMSAIAGSWTPALQGTTTTQPGLADRRFAAEQWTSDPRYQVLARAYLTQTELMSKALEAAPLDEKSKGQWAFALRQVTDALSPANGLATNPEALQLALETGGESLLAGMRLFTEDLAKGRVSMTDDDAFEVGGNLAVTPGKVIFQNELIQLIQYTPTTAKVYQRPLVIVPPCVNKYYILDLRPENSFVKYIVEQGHTVFLVSWRNPGPDQQRFVWDDYLELGVLPAIDVARKICKVDEVNTLGFCIGASLLTGALAALEAKGERTASSMTLFTAMLDFTEGGEMGLLVTESGVAAREAAIGKGGLIKGIEMAQLFASLRANDLIWPYVVNGYLKGQRPPPFDLLYWNSDNTNLPGPMFCWYIRNSYLENRLCKPGGTVQIGERIDLQNISAPAFLYASKEDHIVPWKSAYACTQMFGGKTTFLLGASGHIAGVINPPAKHKRNYWFTPPPVEGARLPADPDTWLDGAERIDGSWWPAWMEWLAQHSGRKVAARKRLGNAEFRPLEDAPGSYVKEKST
jgi:polyhydroxyalkanoate synthase